MVPSEAIVQQAAQPVSVVDAKGRRLVMRRPTALDTLRLLKAAGPVLAQNEAWLGMAGLVFCVLEIDGVPVPTPTSEQQIEALVERLGDLGLAAIAQSLEEDKQAESTGLHVKN